MKKIRCLLAVVAIALFVSLSSFAYNITGWMSDVGFLPEFPVTVNGQEYNYNEYEEYPLLVCRGVTYFPLTYNNSMILNLIPEYDVENPFNIAFTKGNPDEPKTIFKKQLIKEISTPIDDVYVQREVYRYQTHYPRADKNALNYNVVHYDMNYVEQHGVKLTLDGVNLAALTDYPILHFRNIYYIPLSWQFVTEVLGGTVTFDAENGLEVRVNNYFTTLNETEKITYAENCIIRDYKENYTCYIKDDLTVSLETLYIGLAGTVSRNLKIEKDGKTLEPHGNFGVYQGTPQFILAPQFTVEGTKIKTFVSHEYRGQNPKPCFVDIETGEVADI